MVDGRDEGAKDGVDEEEAHKVARTAVTRLVHERPFESRREAGATTTTKPRLFDLLQDPLVSLEKNLFGLQHGMRFEQVP